MAKTCKNIFKKYAKTMERFFPQKIAKNFYLPHRSSKVLKDKNDEALKQHPSNSSFETSPIYNFSKNLEPTHPPWLIHNITKMMTI